MSGQRPEAAAPSAPAADAAPPIRWPEAPRDDPDDVALRRALRTERTLVAVRWGAVLFGLVQVLTFYAEYPAGVLPVALALVGGLALGNLAIGWSLQRGVSCLQQARRLGVTALTLDVTAAMGLVTVYTFDQDTAMFAVLYLLPLEAAVRFGLRGSLVTMGAVITLYTVREWYGAVALGNDWLPVSISFRMGIGVLIAIVAGQMASTLVRDRTELELAKAQLESSAAALAASNAELAAANEIKDDFLAMTNHELRTPLTTVLGYTTLLRKRWDSISDDRRQEFIGRIEEQGMRLQAMVEELLTLSSAQAGALQLSLGSVEVCAAVDEAIRHHGLAGTQFDNRCQPGLRVLADRKRLGQILVNYLTNARKYGAPPITVSAHSEGRWVVIAVEDRGPGVPEDFVPELFDKFSQASMGDSRTSEGAGLGLAIVQQLAQAQGGEVAYAPGEPHGARFLVRLRRSSEPESASGVAAVEERASH
jgi:signal transduction histidine kinase